MHSDPAVHEMHPQEFVFESMNLQEGVRLQCITYRRLKPVPRTPSGQRAGARRDPQH